MKKNLKFFTSVASMLLVSAVLIVCGMYAIGSDKGEPKPYDNSDSLSDLSDLQDVNCAKPNPPTDFGINKEPPTLTPQKDLQGKFSAMYDVSEDGKSITVISKEYLDKFWQSNYEKEVIHSLTTEEVYFIIQDSIRIYFNYDKVILPEFAPLSSDKQVAERFPNLKGIEIYRLTEKYSWDLEKIGSDIHDIIMYRLTALSSPKAFILGAEAILFVGGDPVTYSSMHPETLFYIPGYSADTDRDYMLTYLGGKIYSKDLERLTDLFEVTIYTYDGSKGSHSIYFLPAANETTTTKVFPTNELKDLIPTTSIYISGDSNDWGTNIALDEGTGRLYMYMSKFSSYPLCGDYTESNGILTYYPENCTGTAPGICSYVFLYEDGTWVYSREKSNPVGYSYDIKDGLRFTLLEKNSRTKKPIASIKDYAEINEIDTADALEQFYEDEKYVYSFPSIKSEYIIVTFTDGTEMNVSEALFKGYIDIGDLDKYSIHYIKEPKK